jgi:hypothetical protein
MFLPLSFCHRSSIYWQICLSLLGVLEGVPRSPTQPPGPQAELSTVTVGVGEHPVCRPPCKARAEWTCMLTQAAMVAEVLCNLALRHPRVR